MLTKFVKAYSIAVAQLNRVGDIFPAALRRNIKLAIRILGVGSKSASIPRLLAAGFLIILKFSVLIGTMRCTIPHLLLTASWSGLKAVQI